MSGDAVKLFSQSMIIDSRTVLIGSFNFSGKTAHDHNGEIVTVSSGGFQLLNCGVVFVNKHAQCAARRENTRWRYM